MMKKLFLITMITLMSCSFYGNKNSDSNETEISSKIKSKKSNKMPTTVPPDSRTKIIGKWYRDEDRTSYWEFKNDNKVYFYSEGTLDATFTYSISHTCGENTDANFEFLKLIDEDNNESCAEINGINEDNSGILSLTSMANLKVTLFVNNVNIIIPN
jgi:hypothetical protein